jgi:hypothetical protein
MSDRAPVRDNGDECDLREGWRKSSYSMSNGHCLEIAHLVDGRVAVRDSKAPDGPVLRFQPESWINFLRRLQDF